MVRSGRTTHYFCVMGVPHGSPREGWCTYSSRHPIYCGAGFCGWWPHQQVHRFHQTEFAAGGGLQDGGIKTCLEICAGLRTHPAAPFLAVVDISVGFDGDRGFANPSELGFSTWPGGSDKFALWFGLGTCSAVPYGYGCRLCR